MADEPIVEAAKEAAHAPTLAELEAEVTKRKRAEDQVRIAACTRELEAVLTKYGLALSARAEIQHGMIVAVPMLVPAPRRNGEHVEE